jgi:hypothetical protein
VDNYKQLTLIFEKDGKNMWFGGERELEIYDPRLDRWSRSAPIPRALHHAGAVGLNGKLYVVGSYVSGWTPTDEAEYDPASERRGLVVQRQFRELAIKTGVDGPLL